MCISRSVWMIQNSFNNGTKAFGHCFIGLTAYLIYPNKFQVKGSQKNNSIYPKEGVMT